MSSAFIDWQDAIADFLLSKRASSAVKTEMYYRAQLRLLMDWAEGKKIRLQDFRARHMREYLAWRSEQGVSDRTRRHDAVTARVLFRYCKREGYVESDPLYDYEIPRAPAAYVKMPGDAEIRLLLEALTNRWKPAINPNARFFAAGVRLFYTRRNYAIITGLVETAARVGELLALTMDDYQPERLQIAIKVAKGDRPRVVPISKDWVDAVEAWLKVRPKCESNLLFVNEYGDAVGVTPFSKQFRGYTAYAGIKGVTLHSLRHYAITQIAKTDLWAASQIAGHKDLTITRAYLHADPVHVRAAHTAASPLGRILVNKRTESAKKKRLI